MDVRAAGRLRRLDAEPPRGHGGDHYLQYSQAPGLLVGNAFAQSLIGLDDFKRITGSSRAGLALERGLHQARRSFRRFDTGAWSLYWHRPGSRHGNESDLHYHVLFLGFLEKLCPRFPSGPFCTLRDNFARYETEPVKIGRLAARRRGRTLHIRYTVSKRGSGTLTLSKPGGHALHSVRLGLSRGSRLIVWDAPRRRGTYELKLETESLNGLESSASKLVKLR